ncbi:TIGR03943 family putative permease subunit [Metabacillus iocasae]|uniref:Repeat protein (TIGR03943 family) n=1 Tax=Priestia iocasae TaxID=2291674 RepID=A0ABS2QSS0_9BACI|nr:TIGR03943 family protein [Metabacillus iocasae]MBM7702440.1 putative repeat protein (TIGR03943 family) [Metabacillus iocasae]
MKDLQFLHYIRGIILIGFALLMFKLMITGDIIHFIAPKMQPFIYFAAITFFLLGVIQIWRSSTKINEASCECGHNHHEGGRLQSVLIYAMFVLPVLTGFLFSDHVLDSSVAAKRGIKFGANVTERPTPEQREELMNQSGTSDDELEQYMNDVLSREIEEPAEEGELPLTHPEDFVPQDPPKGYYEKVEASLKEQKKITVKDEEYIPVMNVIESNVEAFVGKEIEVDGFVYREPEFEDNQFVVARFGLSCCVADASVYGTLATSKHAQKFEEDEWIKVKGVIEQIEYNGLLLPYIQIKEITKIERPANPYVYEFYEGEQLVAPKK